MCKMLPVEFGWSCRVENVLGKRMCMADDSDHEGISAPLAKMRAHTHEESRDACDEDSDKSDEGDCKAGNTGGTATRSATMAKAQTIATQALLSARNASPGEALREILELSEGGSQGLRTRFQVHCLGCDEYQEDLRGVAASRFCATPFGS